MPPSGYKQKQSYFITKFLNSCFDELINEAKELNLTLNDALVKEIKDIEFAIEKNFYSESANSVMLLTKSFYKMSLERLKQNPHLKDPSIILNEINKQILEIDIEQLLEKEYAE